MCCPHSCNFRTQRIAADAAAAAHRDDPALLLAAKAKRYAAMSSSEFGGAVGDAEQFLVDFEQKRYDDSGTEREVDALAAMASSDATCQLRSELESYTANQSSQSTAAKKQRDAALQVRLSRTFPFFNSHSSGAPCQTRSFQRARHMNAIAAN
jgi:hypothetical protein